MKNHTGPSILALLLLLSSLSPDELGSLAGIRPTQYGIIPRLYRHYTDNGRNEFSRIYQSTRTFNEWLSYVVGILLSGECPHYFFLYEQELPDILQISEAIQQRLKDMTTTENNEEPCPDPEREEMENVDNYDETVDLRMAAGRVEDGVVEGLRLVDLEGTGGTGEDQDSDQNAAAVRPADQSQESEDVRETMNDPALHNDDDEDVVRCRLAAGRADDDANEEEEDKEGNGSDREQIHGARRPVGRSMLSIRNCRNVNVIQDAGVGVNELNQQMPMVEEPLLRRMGDAVAEFSGAFVFALLSFIALLLRLLISHYTE